MTDPSRSLGLSGLALRPGPLPRKRRTILFGILLALAAWFPYREAGRNGFVFDDVVIIQNNPRVQSAQIREIFRTEYWNRPEIDSKLYRPVTLLSYALERSLWGPAPGHYHRVNVALHVLVSLLVALLAGLGLKRGRPPAAFEMMTTSSKQNRTRAVREGAIPFPAWIAGLLFAVHPLHSEAVAGVVGRAELLASLFVLACFWTLLQGGRLRTLAPVFLFLALLSKESAVLAFPIIALAVFYGVLPRSRSANLMALGRTLLLLAPGFLGALLLRHLAIGGRPTPVLYFSDNPLVAASPLERIATGGAIFWSYVQLHIWPTNLSPDYSYNAVPVRTLLDPESLLGLGLLLALGGVCLEFLRRARKTTGASVWGGFSLAWFVMGLLSISNLLILLNVVVAERLTYLPGVGFFFLLALGARGALAWASRASAPIGATAPSTRAPSRSVAWSVQVSLALFLGIVLVAFLARSQARTHAWKDARTLFTEAVQDQPGSFRAWVGLGEAQLRDGEHAEALVSLQTAASIHAEDTQLQNMLALVQHALGDFEAAENAALRAEALASRSAAPAFVLADLYLREGRLDEAQAQTERGLRLEPDYAPLHYTQGKIRRAQGRTEEATGHFLRTIELDPEALGPKQEAGAMLIELERWSEAIPLYRDLNQRMADWSSANSLAWSLLQEVRGTTASEAGRREEMLAEARSAAEAAVARSPAELRRYALDTLASVQWEGKRPAEAIATMERLVRDFPNEEQYQKTLAAYRAAFPSL